MWQFVTPSRKRIKGGHISARRTPLYRPHCTLLEDRCLLSVSLSGSEPPVPVVGSLVIWTATASGHGQTPVYQFRVGPTGRPFHVVRDFSPSNTFIWNPMQEGSYDIQVTVKDGFSASTGESATASYTADSRVAGTGAVVSPTSNPLVALYSAPPSSGSSMHVEFKPVGSNQSWSSTAELPIVPGESTNFLVAGMLPDSTYLMRHVLDDATTSAPLTFKTGPLPTNLTFPTFTVQQAPTPGTDLTQDIVFHVGIGPYGTVDTVATDLMGNIVWYYDSVANGFTSYAPSLVPGGTALLLGGNPRSAQGGEDTLREIDLAGDTLRETNIDAVNAELAALGQHSITDFNHDAQRLPNGDTAVLATTPRTIDVRGKPILYKGDMVLILDQNFQVAWVWDPFNWLNVHRLPTLGEGPSDWTHANSIAWSPADGNLVVSLRSRDWVIKINYANGTGDGHVLWRLGPGGDVRINSTAPSPWFSHQHDVRYINSSTLVLFDNGNTRHRKSPRAHSRGQELVLDEKTRVATLVVNADLGNYAPYTGSAQMLPNGNLDFDSPLARQTIEVLPDGRTTYVLRMNMDGVQYRSYIYATLYGDAADSSLPSTPIPPRLARRLAILERQAQIRQSRRARPHEIRQSRQARLVVRPQPGPPSAPGASLTFGLLPPPRLTLPR
jgi:arylsulfate sulfotransferase